MPKGRLVIGSGVMLMLAFRRLLCRARLVKLSLYRCYAGPRDTDQPTCAGWSIVGTP